MLFFDYIVKQSQEMRPYGFSVELSDDLFEQVQDWAKKMSWATAALS